MQCPFHMYWLTDVHWLKRSARNDHERGHPPLLQGTEPGYGARRMRASYLIHNPGAQFTKYLTIYHKIILSLS